MKEQDRPRLTIQEDFADAKAKNMSWEDMLNNLDKRAKSLGNRLSECIAGSKVSGSLAEINIEASELKNYRVKFVDFLMEELKNPEYNRPRN